MPFSQEALDFLAENRFQNSRDYYEAHKPLYRRTVVAPMQQLISDLAQTMYDIDDRILCEPKIGGSISRVVRDTRFSRDKSLYRDTAWCTFMRSKKLWFGMPAFFFEFSPRILRWGCGYYQASPETMESLRAMVLREDPLFLAADEAYRGQSGFLECSDRYKRDRYPHASPAQKAWLNLKSVCWIKEEPDLSVLFREDLADLLAREFRSLVPLYRLLLQAEVEKTPPETAWYR